MPHGDHTGSSELLVAVCLSVRHPQYTNSSPVGQSHLPRMHACQRERENERPVRWTSGSIPGFLSLSVFDRVTPVARLYV